MGATVSASIKHRPIYGGVFGKGRYSLASMPCISNGLHAVRYMVIEPRAGSVLAQADDKLGALESARRLLRATSALAQRLTPAMEGSQGSLWPAEALPAPANAGAGIKQAPKRRREVFERCGGRCHYCSTPLTLDGKWHIEHMVPKALDGDDQPLNLVASCVPCNLQKSDRTALEFVSAMRLRDAEQG